MSDQVCDCNQVSEDEIKKAIAEGAATVDAVGEATGAGTGCGSCQCTIEELLEK